MNFRSTCKHMINICVSFYIVLFPHVQNLMSYHFRNHCHRPQYVLRRVGKVFLLHPDWICVSVSIQNILSGSLNFSRISWSWPPIHGTDLYCHNSNIFEHQYYFRSCHGNSQRRKYLPWWKFLSKLLLLPSIFPSSRQSRDLRALNCCRAFGGSLMSWWLESSTKCVERLTWRAQCLSCTPSWRILFRHLAFRHSRCACMLSEWNRLAILERDADSSLLLFLNWEICIDLRSRRNVFHSYLWTIFFIHFVDSITKVFSLPFNDISEEFKGVVTK